jgi:MFS family permease
VILAVGTLCVFGAVGMGRFGYGMLVPSMQLGLGMNNVDAGILATANLVGYLVMSVIGGALATRFGARIVISAGMLLAGIGMVLTGWAALWMTAAVWRLLTGLGTGAVNVPTMGLVSAWFSRERRGLAVGVVLAGQAAALIVAGFLFPWILSVQGDMNGWRLCWHLVGGLTIVLGVVAILFMRNGIGDSALIMGRERAVSVAGISAEAMAGPTRGRDTARAGVAEAGLNWRLVYRSGHVVHLGMVYLTYGFSYIIFMTFFTTRLVSDMSFTEGTAGRLFMLLGLLSVFSAGLWGWVSDRVGRKPVIIVILSMLTASLAVLALPGSTASVLLSTVLFGLSSWSVPVLMAATCADAVGPRMGPAALGLITLFFGVGQAVAPTVAGAMADAANGFSSAFWLAAGVMGLGTLGAVPLRRSWIEGASHKE